MEHLDMLPMDTVVFSCNTMDTIVFSCDSDNILRVEVGKKPIFLP